MTIALGRIGIWGRTAQITPEIAIEVERLGYGAIWIGGSPDGRLEHIETLLDATSTIAVATGIVNMWRDDPSTVADAYQRVASTHADRFLLGVGIGHPETTSGYRDPYDTMVAYLDVLDASGVPRHATVLAALGPRVLRLAADRTAGAHPYLTTPHHTRQARGILGDGVLLAPEQNVVIDTDPERARSLGRPAVEKPYLGLVNYRKNLMREGWSEADLNDGGSDALIDALVVHGDVNTVAAGVTAHLDAGADHVSIQALGADLVGTFAALAPALLGN